MSGPSSENPSGDPRENPQASESRAENADKPPSDAKPERLISDGESTCSKSDKEKHHAEERKFWNRQIRVGKWLNRVTGAASIAALIGLGILYKTLVETQRASNAAAEANRINQRALEANTRAWVVPGIVEIERLEVDKPLKVRIEFANVGKEPALSLVEYNESLADYLPQTNAYIRSFETKWEWCSRQPTRTGAMALFPSAGGGPQAQYHLTLGAVVVDDALIKGEKACQ